MRNTFILCMTFIFFITHLSYTNAAVESWYLTDETIKGYRPVLKTNNMTIDKKINDEINNYIYAHSAYFKNMYYYGDIIFDYVVTYEDDNVISLLMSTSSYNKGKSLKTYHGLCFNKQNGARYRLNNFLRITDNDIGFLANQCYYDVSCSVKSHELSGYNFKKAKVHLHSPTKKVSTDFFLLGNGEIALIYQNVNNDPKKEFSVIRLESGQITYYNHTNK